MSVRIKDPYARALSEILKFDPPPTTAAPATGSPNCLHLFVPSENTQLDFGAGASPGIGMITDAHAHITARSPFTTISLGAPTESQWAGAEAAGLNLYTEGAKHETVEKDVFVTCGADKHERLRGNLDLVVEGKKLEDVGLEVVETYRNTKHETVACAVTEDYQNAHTWNVGDIAKHSFAKNKEEHIGGDSNVTVGGNKHETVLGDEKYVRKGNYGQITKGTSNDVCLGEKSSTVVGASMSLNAGPTLSATVGAVAISITTPVKVTRDHVSMSRTTYKRDKVICKDEDSEVMLGKFTTSIMRAVTFIVK